MDDGVLWSAQSDFIARLAEWEKDTDIVWPLQRTERSSLLALNIPHFVSPGDQIEIRDATGVAIRIKTEFGLDRAQARAQNLDEDEIKWQIEVIKENTSALSIASGPAVVDGNVIIASRSNAAHRARWADFHPRGRQNRRRAIGSRNSPRARSRVDWSGLAGRCGSFPARMPGARPLQWRIRHRGFSRRACSSERTSAIGRTCSRQRVASSKKLKGPKCRSDGPLLRCWWRHRAGLGCLCLNSHVEMPA